MAGLYVFLGIMIVSLVGIALVSALEKRLVWPYVPAGDVPPERCPQLNAYANEASAAAAAERFTWLGAFVDGKGKRTAFATISSDPPSVTFWHWSGPERWRRCPCKLPGYIRCSLMAGDSSRSIIKTAARSTSPDWRRKP